METGFFADIIKEVLVRGDVACLPGFGSFTTEQVPAYFSDKGFTINPPYLRPVFDESITDDMALVDFYAENNGLSRSRAQDIIMQEVASLRRELSSAKAVLLPGLGCLRMPHEGNVIFIADELLQIFPHYDLLEPVSLRHLDAASFVARMKEGEHEAHTEPEVQTVDNVKSQSRPGKVVLVTILVMLCVAAVALAVLAVLGRLFPDAVDMILYNAEELEILKAKI